MERLLARGCFDFGSVAPAAFYSMTLYDSVNAGMLWPEGLNDRFSSTISGWVSDFFGGCFTMEALLASTLDCLHDTECLTNLANYFPTLNRVCLKNTSIRS